MKINKELFDKEKMKELESNPYPAGTEEQVKFLKSFVGKKGICSDFLQDKDIVSDHKLRGLIEVIMDIDRRLKKLEKK